MTKSVKEWKSHTEQLTLLKQRGLHITHETKALYSLKTIGYYRLSGYLYPFRAKNVNGTKLDTFLPNSHFEDVKQLYIFDKKLSAHDKKIKKSDKTRHNSNFFDELNHAKSYQT